MNISTSEENLTILQGDRNISCDIMY